MSDSTETILQELQAVLEETTGLKLHPLVMHQIFDDEEMDIIAEVTEWGAYDTAVRENAANELSKALVGQKWPTYADRWTDEQLDDFVLSQQKVHDRLLGVLLKEGS
jgi:hypothetical protein